MGCGVQPRWKVAGFCIRGPDRPTFGTSTPASTRPKLLAIWPESPRVRVRKPPFFWDTRMPFEAVAFDPDGTYVVSGGVDRFVRVWEHNRLATVTDGETAGQRAGVGELHIPVRGQICALRGCEDDVVGVGVTPAGEIISASRDGRIRAWLPGTEDVPQLRGHGTSVGSVAYSPDGRYLVSADQGPGVIIWDAARCVPVAARDFKPATFITDVACWNAGSQTMLAVATVTQQSAGPQTADGRVLMWALATEAEQCSLDSPPIVLPSSP